MGELLLQNLRTLLNRDGVRLWTGVYLGETSETDEAFQELSKKYSEELKRSPTDVLNALKLLQSRALEKLNAKKFFEETGIATLQARNTLRFGRRRVRSADANDGKEKIESVKVSLDASGAELKREISELLNAEQPGQDMQLKIIFKGRVISDDTPLRVQGVNHGCVLLVLQLGSPRAQTTAENVFQNVDLVKEDALKAAKSSSGLLQITDQRGASLFLSQKERISLSVAMALHERGKVAMKRSEYPEALIFLTEADAEFQKCRSDILDRVDNLALLSLDIAWCHVQLQSPLTALPDAERRLLNCEEKLRRTYGDGLQRAAYIKGHVAGELTQMMRLHLIQGILAFHQGRIDHCKILFQKTEEELRELNVDEAAMSQLLSMGYTVLESRLSLRATKNNITEAIAWIHARRQAKEETKEKERRLKKLGWTVRGNEVDESAYKSLRDMGYSHYEARMSLSVTDNHVAEAVRRLTENRSMFILPTKKKAGAKKGEASKMVASSSSTSTGSLVEDGVVQELCSMGFEVSQVRSALEICDQDKAKAADLLLSGDIPASGSTETPSGRERSDTVEESGEDDDDESEALEANDRLRHGLFQTPESEDADAYLDVPLEEERNVLQEYKALLYSSLLANDVASTSKKA
ncbi:unnamed protein product [Cyprideis torosa]|uniref:Uncharacterized protein n=1 Tax=Cyprideis torosa TaxID=163714 RepID=A0A7R8ZM72_9CRUS|nr:unnamed protein product [Cyprideis torosa]CAG0893533.1 unnamed protein product [Cyprideis torosa]